MPFFFFTQQVPLNFSSDKTLNPKMRLWKNLTKTRGKTPWSSRHLKTQFHKAPLTILRQKLTDPCWVNCCWQLELFQWKCLISNRDISNEKDIGNPALKQLLFLMLSPTWELMSLHKTDFAWVSHGAGSGALRTVEVTHSLGSDVTHLVSSERTHASHGFGMKLPTGWPSNTAMINDEPINA